MIRQYRKQWLRWHSSYERTARIIFQRTFKEIAKDIPFERMSAGTYKAYLQTHVSKEKIFDSYVKVYSEIGTKHGKRVGVQINKQINEKNFTIDGFLNEFQRTLINFLATNEGSRITTVRQSYIQYLTQIMTKGIEEGKTMSMISTDMTKLIKSRNFYRWQALRIARTETTAASNYAATVSSSVSGVLMDKVWVSALDARTRREPESHFDHYHMNQVKVPLDKPFEVSGEKLMFPGDPKGSAGNVINCRCSVAQVVRRDANGNIMRVSDVPKIPNTDINTTIRNIEIDENKIRNNNFESAFAYDLKGNRLFEEIGTKSQVSFSIDNRVKLALNKGSIVTHNHPSGFSFSGKDFEFLLGNDLSELRAVTNKYNHSIKLDYKSLEGINIDDRIKLYNEAFKEANKIEQEKLNKIFKDPLNPPSQDVVDNLEKDVLHGIWESFTNNTKFGKKYFSYVRTSI